VNPATATEPTTTPPEPPRRRATFRNVAALIACGLGAALLADNLIFRSGLYANFLEPEYSATGNLERAVYAETHRAPSGRKEILVVGNSRIAEGFSAKMANAHSAADDYFFVNFGIPGSGNRVWYYVIRDIDPKRDRYAAITIMIDDYDDPDDYEDVADRASELPMLINRLRLTDIVPYTMSFTTWKSRLQVLRGLLIEGTVYQGDFQDFMEHPLRRLDRAASLRQLGSSYGYDYEGMDHSLAGLSVDYEHQKITFPEGMPEDRQQELRAIFFHNPPQDGRIRELQMRWLVPLVDFYRDSKTRIIFYQTPRSPAPPPVSLAHWSWTTVDEMRKRPWVRVIDRHVFEDLEKPELFADHVHLNAAGRKLFSPRLAEVVKKALQ
jgi:hypothetical protein